MKKCPKCKKKAVKLYINKTVDKKRKWVPISWLCTSCGYVYQVASDTLIYEMGEIAKDDKSIHRCPNCDMKLVRSYRHKNPKQGKQQWLAMGWYCSRCKYCWINSTG